VMNVFLCRSDTQTAFSLRLFTNKLLLLGVATEVALIVLIDYTPWGNLVFGTSPIGVEVWLYVVPFMLGMLALEEGRKRLVRNMF